MKSIAVLATIAMVSAQAEATNTTVSDKVKDDTVYYVDGVKGFYDGYYTGLYKNSQETKDTECLNDATVEELIKFMGIAEDPWSLLSWDKLSEDLNLF